ncbi:MAG: NADH-quinone oxidoreductase subunit H, partial [Aminivibrio sp.]|nr:NADH-quinone oxidoreductase subunit H [Aminivibrio sp.]
MVVVSLIMRLIAGAALMLLVAALAFLFEGVDRVVHARMQRRIGPPVFQPFLDLVKLMGKENIVPRRAVPWAFNGAPWVAAATMLLVFLYIPIGSLPPILGGEGDMILVIYLLGLSGVAMAVGGFASGNPIANVGAQREMILMMSYELPLAVVVSTLAYVAYKTGMPGEPFSLETFAGMSVWGVVGKVGFLGIFCLFLALVLVVPGETGKGPMDIPEAKTEILEGLVIEYSGTNLAMFKITFALRATAMAAIITAIFFPWSLGSFLGFGSI